MKQLIVFLIVSTLVLTACGRRDETPDAAATEQAAVADTPTPEPTAMPAPTDTPIPVPPTDTPAPVPTDTPIPEPPTPEATPSAEEGSAASEVVGTPTIVVAPGGRVATDGVPLNVRGGPGTDYTVLGGLQPGTEVALLARSEDGAWYQIAYPPGSGELGWVAGEFIEVQGSTDGLPVAQAPDATSEAATAPAIEPTSEVVGTPAITPTVSAPDVSLTPTITATAVVTDVTGTAPLTDTIIARVATDGDVLNVRGGPGTEYQLLGTLEAGAEVALLVRSADGAWFQIVYPVGSDGRGWVAGEFLEIQGSPDGLPTEGAPEPTPPEAVQAVDVCAPIPNEMYGTRLITSAPTDPPAEVHADLNLSLRGYEVSDAASALIDLAGATDPAAPQLRWLFGDRRMPEITTAYQVYDWDWGVNTRGALISDPEVTLLGLGTTPGETISTPDGGSDLGEGYHALVLYASPERITIKYTPDDNVVSGYTVHIEDVCVDPALLALYQERNDAGRGALPALRPGQPLGRATGSEIAVAVRDNGRFMEPRSSKDWWSGQ